MLNDIFNILGSAIAGTISWFDVFMSGELWTLVFSILSMSLVVRFIIIPFFGKTGASDRAKRKNGD